MREDGNTGDMIVKIPEIIEYLSYGITLYPSDIIATGNCSGVAFSAPGDLYLKDGDILEPEVEGVGARKRVVQET